jgi:hypothetical protein
MDKRWGLNIDIEGFSNLYESGEESQSRAIWSLQELMRSIIQIGIKVYPGVPQNNFSDRLFAHQFGDGFIIVSTFQETDASRCIALATSLTRHMLTQGIATKTAISTGSMSDINGCYPEEMRNVENNTLSLGMGLMTSIPVMGTALTKAHKLGGRVSGNVIVIDNSQFSTIPSNLISKNDSYISYVNWYSDDHDLAKSISQKAGLEFSNEKQLNELFISYIAKEPRPPQKWVDGSKNTQVMGSKSEGSPRIIGGHGILP